jgi:hypothetical protein
MYVRVENYLWSIGKIEQSFARKDSLEEGFFAPSLGIW